MSEKSKKYAPVIVRIGTALVFLWFGISQILVPAEWTGWLPHYARILPISSETLVFINGFFETTLGLFLFVGFYTRIAAWFLSIHMAHVMTVVGYNEIGVRDFGIFVATLSVAFHGAGDLSLDSVLDKQKAFQGDSSGD